MANLISRDALKQKVAEGFIIGVMVSLTMAVCGIVWKAFNDATERLESAEELLKEQKEFNGELISKLHKGLETNKKTTRRRCGGYSVYSSGA